MPLDTSTPLVSVVIPTHGRPETLLRAVNSALNQTFEDLEVIVIIDGLEPKTEELIRSVGDPRLRTICLAESVGGSEARNVGTRASRGNWVSFLDDDDEWLPTKIESQFYSATSIQRLPAFVACRYIERSELGDRILPIHLPDPNNPISETLFCRKGFRVGTGYVQTSTWLISRDLALSVPFTKGLRRNQDADWMLRALKTQEVAVVVVPQPLVVFSDYTSPNRVSKRADWRFHHEWALRNREYFTRKAMAFFLLTACVQDAITQREGRRTIFFILFESFRLGSPTIRALCFFLYYLSFSTEKRVRIRAQKDRVKACA